MKQTSPGTPSNKSLHSNHDFLFYKDNEMSRGKRKVKGEGEKRIPDISKPFSG